MSEKTPLAPDDSRHGSDYAYAVLGCRCDACRAAGAAKSRRYRDGHREELLIKDAARRQRPEVKERERARTLAPDDPRHGSQSTYVHYWCRCDACTAANSAHGKQYARDHPEQAAASRLRFRESHRDDRYHDEEAVKDAIYRQRPEVKERERIRQRSKKRVRPDRSAYRKEWREKNLRRVMAKGTAYREANRAALNTKQLAYAKAHPEVVSANSAARRSRVRGAPGRFTPAEFRDKCVLLGNVCVYCGKSGPLVADHDIPLARKELHPTNDIGNILPACAHCNSRKKDKTAAEFRALLARRH